MKIFIKVDWNNKTVEAGVQMIKGLMKNSKNLFLNKL